MPIARHLADLRAKLAQCDSLIANAHKVDAAGIAVLPPVDQRQITVAALLNAFVAWETFLEQGLASFMSGQATLSGTLPTKYVSPLDEDSAKRMVIGVNRYFDYGNHELYRKVVGMFFHVGYPFEPHLSAINGELSDLRTLRNASAHISSTTQSALDALALRIFGAPRPSVDLYSLLMSVDPRTGLGDTVFVRYRKLLEVTAELIAQG